jgi:DNA-binding MarR family transcriptional regulator
MSDDVIQRGGVGACPAGAPDTGDDLDRLLAELTRYMRLTHRFKGLLSVGTTGVDQSALMLLGPLTAMGPLRVTHLAEVKHADPSTVSRQAAQLVRAGLARREPDPVDGRATRLAVTAEGHAACVRLQAQRRALVAAALHEWPPDRVAQFLDLFHEFNTAVENHVRRTTGLPAPAGHPDIETPSSRETT